MTENRTVFVSQRFPPDKGGNAARIRDITTHLADTGWDVTVLAPPPSYPPGEFDRSWKRKRTETVDGVTVHRLWSWQPQTERPDMARRLAYYLLFGIQAMCWLVWNVREYDCVVTTTPPISTGAPGLVAAALGKPWVVDVRDLWIDASISLGYLEAGSTIERVSRWFQWLVLHSADRIAVTTESLGESLQETYGSSLASKTIVIPNGVDVERFQPSSEPESRRTDVDRGSARVNETAGGHTDREQEGPPDATPDRSGSTIIYTGNLGSAQDLESCIRAMVHLPDDSAVLRLVGSGDRESHLKQLAADLGLEERVEFHGLVPREEIPTLLGDATIGIAPLQDTSELSYAMPTKLYEYMASTLPTVVTGRGEIEGFVEKTESGIHTANDPEAIADAFQELLTDRSLRRRLGTNGRDHVERKYDRKAIAHKLGDELATLTGGRIP